VKRRALLAIIVSAVLTAAVWALSIPITGRNEPSDADSPYYFVALAIAGAVSGAAVPKHLWPHYVGAVLGQAAYELAFLKLGPLFIVGLAFLAGYSIIFVVAAAIVALLRKAGTSEH
jgi:hypothetical protein